MKRLMEYGLNESKQTNASNSGILEYSQMGADGNTYGIIREGTKYFIKVAPKKHTKVLTEDFDYLGGFLGKKPFDSYTKASKALNLHLISLNEDGSKPVKSQFNLNESAEWQTKTTLESRKELNRFYELVSKVDNLLNENNHYINENENNPYVDKGKASYNTTNGGGHKGNIGTQQPLGITEEGFTDNDQHNAETMQKKYQNANMGKSGFGDHNIDEDGGNPYQEKPTKKNMNEGKKRVIKLSEEQKKQVLAWRDDRAFVHDNVDTDRSHGTHIGDTAPWDEPVNEAFETEEWGSEGLPSSAGIGDAKKYRDPFDNLTRQPMTEMDDFRRGIGQGSISENLDLLAQAKDTIMNAWDEADSDDSEETELPEEENEMPDDEFLRESVNRIVENTLNDIEDENGMFGDEYPGDDSILDDIPDTDGEPSEEEPSEEDVLGEPDTDDIGNDEVDPELGWDENDWGHRPFDPNGGLDDPDNFEQEEDDFSLYEGVVLNDFGKHPAYRKRPMTLPANADGSEWGEDWNDESAKNELPFGRKIGKGDPFNQAVDAITNAVVDMLGKKKS